MSKLYLYAIIDQSDAPLPVHGPGVQGGGLYKLNCGRVAAVVSNVRGEVEVSEAALWQHETIVERLMASHAVLPVRFKTVIPDADMLLNLLRNNQCRFASDLERVKGKVELAVRVLWHGDTAQGEADRDDPPGYPYAGGQTGVGWAYMMTCLQKEQHQRDARQKANELARNIHSALVPLAAQSNLTTLNTQTQLMAAAYLVKSDQVGPFADQVAVLGATHPELQFTCTGPWPAYSFVQAWVV